MEAKKIILRVIKNSVQDILTKSYADVKLNQASSKEEINFIEK
jgi:hypothetical protein